MHIFTQHAATAGRRLLHVGRRTAAWVALSGVVPLFLVAGLLWLAAGREAGLAQPEAQVARAMAPSEEGVAKPHALAWEKAGLGTRLTPVSLSFSGEAASALPHLRVVETAPDLASAEKAYARERNCLAQAIYFEARGESIMGQSAVAEVVLNRVADPRYPKTICGTVFQNVQMKNRCQFSFACDDVADRTVNVEAWHVANRLADQLLLGLNRHQLAGTATHYHADYVMPYWAPTLVRVAKIGQHVFYRNPGSPARSSDREG